MSQLSQGREFEGQRRRTHCSATYSEDHYAPSQADIVDGSTDSVLVRTSMINVPGLSNANITPFSTDAVVSHPAQHAMSQDFPLKLVPAQRDHLEDRAPQALDQKVAQFARRPSCSKKRLGSLSKEGICLSLPGEMRTQVTDARKGDVTS